MSTPINIDRCPHCGERIAEKARRVRHAEGLDATRLDCPHQDVQAIREARRGPFDLGKVRW